jgi:hypothetical protein
VVADAGEVDGGWIGSLLERALSNITVRVDNIVCKYLFSGHVLTLSCQSAEIFSAGNNWEKAFLVGFKTPSLHSQSLGDIHAYICRSGNGATQFLQETYVFQISCFTCHCYPSKNFDLSLPSEIFSLPSWVLWPLSWANMLDIVQELEAGLRKRAVVRNISVSLDKLSADGKVDAYQG